MTTELKETYIWCDRYGYWTAKVACMKNCHKFMKKSCPTTGTLSDKEFQDWVDLLALYEGGKG